MLSVSLPIKQGCMTKMITFRRILCPTDLTTDSDQALRYAVALARSYDAKLFICYCAQDSPLAKEHDCGQGCGCRNLFKKALACGAHPEDGAGLDWEGRVIGAEDAGEAITRAAAEGGDDLIVMLSRRRPHRAVLLGSTAELICRTAPCPVLVTHADEREWVSQTCEVKLSRVLVAYDFSDDSELALRYGLSLAQECQAELHLLHVLPTPDLFEPDVAWETTTAGASSQKALRRLQAAVPEEDSLWCTVKNAVRWGSPYHEVLAYAEDYDIDLICMGSRGAGYGVHTLFGSNTDRVLRQTKCPILVARPLKPKSTASLGA